MYAVLYKTATSPDVWLKVMIVRFRIFVLCFASCCCWTFLLPDYAALLLHVLRRDRRNSEERHTRLATCEWELLKAIIKTTNRFRLLERPRFLFWFQCQRCELPEKHFHIDSLTSGRTKTPLANPLSINMCKSIFQHFFFLEENRKKLFTFIKHLAHLDRHRTLQLFCER